MNNALSDRFGRRLKYLRISVTDRCNFRCRYCMPQTGFTQVNCRDILRYEDILFAARVFASLGVRRVRVTGGEPLVRKDICGFLKQLSLINGIDEIMLTTNGSLLNKFASDLKNAGVKRLNISLDSLREGRNSFITGTTKFADVMEGIRTASKIGFSPLKVNAVVIRGFNDDELEDFCRFSAEENIIVRFIEFMPIGNSPDWNADAVVSGREILEKIKSFDPVPVIRDINSGPAQNYTINNGGTVGIITPISRHFCCDCDKLRLTSDGKIRPCLLSDKEIDLKAALKSRNEDLVKSLIVESLNIKGKEHEITTEEKNDDFKRTMSKIGG